MEKKVSCCNHGERYPAFVCQHLVKNAKVGFWEPFDSDPSKTYKDDELNAWCDKCDEVLTQEGEWNDKSEEFAQIKLICDKCFFDMKAFNGGASNSK